MRVKQRLKAKKSVLCYAFAMYRGTRTPRVFGDKFGDEFVTEFGDH